MNDPHVLLNIVLQGASPLLHRAFLLHKPYAKLAQEFGVKKEIYSAIYCIKHVNSGIYPFYFALFKSRIDSLFYSYLSYKDEKQDKEGFTLIYGKNLTTWFHVYTGYDVSEIKYYGSPHDVDLVINLKQAFIYDDLTLEINDAKRILDEMIRFSYPLFPPEPCLLLARHILDIATLC